LEAGWEQGSGTEVRSGVQGREKGAEEESRGGREGERKVKSVKNN